MTVVYTPLHGTGNIPARRVLKEIGFENVYVVPEQELPDGDFPTVSYPNPEAAEAFELALALAKQHDADLVLATDPDADRLGVYVKDKDGEYHCLTGNMSGSLLAEYELSQIKATKGLPKDGALIKSIVTTNLVDEIAKAYNVKLIEVLTGFKWIGKEILGFEQSGKGTYLFGLEESYGCLIGTYARDKDAVSACTLLAEICAWAKDQGKTLFEVLLDIYVEYGFSIETTVNVVKPGKSGAEEIKAMMENFRSNPPREIGGSKVVLVKDFKTLKVTDGNGNITEIDMPEASNVLQYFTEDGTKISVRPSGTAPKIKFYVEV